MNRREFIRLAALTAGYFMFGNARQSEAKDADLKKGYRIVLISDLHLPWRSKNFPDAAVGEKIFAQKKKMLNDIKSWSDVKEATLLGDFPARYGNEEEFLSVDKFLKEISVPYYIAIGNHDYAYREKPKTNGKLERGTHKEQIKKLNAFKKRYNMPALYYARTIGKYRLVYLAPDACGKLSVELSKTQLEWLKKEIATHNEHPMIFFCHAPLMGTLEKYHKSINRPNSTAQPDDTLSEILKDAPKSSLWVSGHTHTPATNPSFANDAINRYNEKIVNIHNPTLDGNGLWTNSLYLYDDKIVVKTYDHLKNVCVEKFTREYKQLN